MASYEGTAFLYQNSALVTRYVFIFLILYSNGHSEARSSWRNLALSGFICAMSSLHPKHSTDQEATWQVILAQINTLKMIVINSLLNL